MSIVKTYPIDSEVTGNATKGGTTSYEIDTQKVVFYINNQFRGHYRRQLLSTFLSSPGQ